MAEYIDRNTAIAKVTALEVIEPLSTMVDVKRLLADMPAADVAPVRHGSWLPQVVLGQKAWDCSESKTLGSPQWRWCPVCGAKMEEGAGNV